jgi:hypothetical protein
MALHSDEHPGRWRIYVETRDCLKGILAPRSTLPHLLCHGKRISEKARVRRPNRPLQSVMLTKLININ